MTRALALAVFLALLGGCELTRYAQDQFTKAREAVGKALRPAADFIDAWRTPCDPPDPSRTDCDRR